MYAVWNDHCGNGISTKDIHHRCYPALQTLAVKMWTGVSKSVPYEEFDKKRHALSEAPGVNQLGRLSKTPGLAYEQANVTPNSTLPVQEIGYDYRVEFDIEGAKEAMGTELFRSKDAVFYLSDPISGMMGYARDGYLNTFTYNVQPGQKMKIAIEGDNKATRLFINGKMVEELNIQERWMDKEGKTRIRNVRTLVFPLEKAGNFQSKITNLKVWQK
jgi:hexosaminidase